VIKVNDLKAGMKFDAPVVFEGENMFAAPGVPVRSRDIERLKRLGVSTVVTMGNLLPETTGQEGQTLRLFYMQKAEGKCLREYRELLKRLSKVFEDIRKRQRSDREEIAGLANAIYRIVKDEPNQMVQIVHNMANSGDDLASGALACAIISTVMGLIKRIYGHELLKLTTAAMLHDVGMLRIPDSIRLKKGKLSAGEKDVVKTHPAISDSIIVKELGLSPEMGDVALSHHERWDGQGYPRRLKATEILDFAELVSVSDAYTALLYRKPYRQHLLGYDAVKAILRDVNTLYSPEMVSLLLKSVGIYPVGSFVLLNDYSIGRVAEKHVSAPLRPIVEILVDKYGRKIEPSREVDLGSEEFLFIQKAIDPEDVLV